MKTVLRTITMGIMMLTVGLLTDGFFDFGVFVKKAEARIGRPLTPLSVAGVARRTTRRVIHRTAVYVATLPRGCTTVVIEGTSLHQCGATYYQPQGNQFVVITVN
jgi:hypothetical protein